MVRARTAVHVLIDQTLIAPLRKSLFAIFTFTHAGFFARERRVERGAELLDFLDVRAEPAARLDDFFVARVLERRRDRALLAVELDLAAADLRPARVVADDARRRGFLGAPSPRTRCAWRPKLPSP